MSPDRGEHWAVRVADGLDLEVPVAAMDLGPDESECDVEVVGGGVRLGASHVPAVGHRFKVWLSVFALLPSPIPGGIPVCAD